MVAEYGSSARSIVDVGSGVPPFLRHVHWVPHRMAVGPYFVSYKGKATTGSFTENNITFVQADFMQWKPSVKYDVVICSQGVCVCVCVCVWCVCVRVCVSARCPSW
jgi:hypothetical protein